MADYIATTEQFTATADAIRSKTGSSGSLEWDASTGYADDIAAIYTGVDTSDATAEAGDILYGKTAYVDGEKVTGTIATKTSADLSASGKNVIVPAGYYATQASGSVASGSATAPASISGSSASVSTGTNTLTLSKTVSVTPSVSAGYVSSGTAGNSSVSLTASVAVKNTDTITPTTSDQTIAAGTYIKGKQTIKGDANLVSSNIASGVSIFGIAGSHQSGTDTSDATAVAGDILYGKTAYVNGSKVTGTIATKTKSNLSASGATVTVPAGYYASQATKDVATGSATAPASISGSSATVSTGTNTLTLTKTVSVTPSVSAGYVSSGTAGNSSVSLTASVTTKEAETITPTTSNKTIAAGTYLTGAQTILGSPNLVAGNIKSGVSIFGVSGSYSGPTSYSVPLARLARIPFSITSVNKYYYTYANDSNLSMSGFIYVPTNATKVSITCDVAGCILAFLNTVTNLKHAEIPDFSSGYSARIALSTGTTTYDISSGMNIMYILLAKSNGGSVAPSSVTFTLL